jgi:hypothetical protein
VNKSMRPCGPDCRFPDLEHREPELDWIGNDPVEHGESDNPVPGTGGWNGLYTQSPEAYCLCGHPNYLSCPRWATDGIGSWVIEAAGQGDPDA